MTLGPSPKMHVQHSCPIHGGFKNKIGRPELKRKHIETVPQPNRRRTVSAMKMGVGELHTAVHPPSLSSSLKGPKSPPTPNA